MLALMARDVERKTGWPQWRASASGAKAATVAFTGMWLMESTYSEGRGHPPGRSG